VPTDVTVAKQSVHFPTTPTIPEHTDEHALLGGFARANWAG